MKETNHFDINEKRFTILVPEGIDSQIAIKSLGSGDICKQVDELKLVKPVFKSPDHPIWYEIVHYNEKEDNHKVLARIQVDLIKDTVKPISQESLPDVTGVECEKCYTPLATMKGDVKLMTLHARDCGGKFIAQTEKSVFHD